MALSPNASREAPQPRALHVSGGGGCAKLRDGGAENLVDRRVTCDRTRTSDVDATSSHPPGRMAGRGIDLELGPTARGDVSDRSHW